MFSTAQQTYIDNTVLEMYLQGYKYYIVHSNTNFDNIRYFKDLTFYFSKEEIVMNGVNSFAIPKGSLRMSVNTSNSYREERYEKVETMNFSGNVNVPNYEFMYSNVGMYSNCLAEYEMELNNVDVINTSIRVGSITVLIIFLFLWLSKIFK